MKIDHRLIILLKRRIIWYLLAMAISIAGARVYVDKVSFFKEQRGILVDQASTNTILSVTGDFQKVSSPLSLDPFTQKVVRLLNDEKFYDYLTDKIQEDRDLVERATGNVLNSRDELLGSIRDLVNVSSNDDQMIDVFVLSKEMGTLRRLSTLVVDIAIAYVNENQLAETDQAINYLKDQSQAVTLSARDTLQKIVRLRTEGVRGPSGKASTSINTSDRLARITEELESAEIEKTALELEIRSIESAIESRVVSGEGDESFLAREKLIAAEKERYLKYLSSPSDRAATNSSVAPNRIPLKGSDLYLPINVLVKFLDERRSHLITMENRVRAISNKLNVLTSALPEVERSGLELEFLQKSYLAEIDQLKEIKEGLLSLELKRISVINKLQPIMLKSLATLKRTPSFRRTAILIMFVICAAVFVLFAIKDTLWPKIITKQDVVGALQLVPISVPNLAKRRSLLNPGSFLGSQGSIQEFDGSLSRRAFRHIMNSVNRSIPLFESQSAKIISSQSVRAGEGKSFAILRLALAMRNSGLRVCIVDGDWHKCSLDTEWQSYSRAAKLASDKHESEVDSSVWKFHTRESLNSKTPEEHAAKIASLLSELTQMSGFDVVLIDLPPFRISPEMVPILLKSDLILFVLRSGYSNLKNAAAIKGEIADVTEGSKCKILPVLSCDPEYELNNYGYGYQIAPRARYSRQDVQLDSESRSTSPRKAV